MMTFPEGNRTPPENACVPVLVIMFEYAKVLGLKTPIFEVPVPDDGIMMTFPFGVKTPPENFPVPEAPTLAEFETIGGFVKGLY